MNGAGTTWYWQKRYFVELDEMKTTIDEILQTDVLVIGSGVGGCCAAIQAARMGCKVILIEKDDVLGGAATYFGIAASYFADVSVVAVVGDDFPEEHVEFLRRKGIDTSGLQREKGSTFRWKGEYSADLTTRTTLETQLNVFADFSPKLLSSHCSQDYVFLG